MAKLNKINAKTLKKWAKWLKAQDCGCCHSRIGDTDTVEMDICMGWHDFGDGYEIAWKIGMQSFNNGMQCDLDIDFQMPYDRESGEIYDTLSPIGDIDGVDYGRLAREINATAKRVYEWQVQQEAIEEEQRAA